MKYIISVVFCINMKMNNKHLGMCGWGYRNVYCVGVWGCGDVGVWGVGCVGVGMWGGVVGWRCGGGVVGVCVGGGEC